MPDSHPHHPLFFFGSYPSSAMDLPELPAGRSPRRELQGPRPTPLRINKDSHKISKKPPLAPHPPLQQPQIRPPVIIYTVSPKIIHANPSDFMDLVQRLTGLESSSSSYSSSSSSLSFGASFPGAIPKADINDGGMSPAACYATIDRAARANPERNKIDHSTGSGLQRDANLIEDIQLVGGIERTGCFPGILSPGPKSFSPVPTSFFSPITADPNWLSFFHDLSPILHGNKNFTEGNPFMASPSNIVSSPHPPIDLFNHFSGL